MLEPQPIDPALLLEQAPDGVIFADREGVIRAWNAAATRIFGHSAEEAIGQTLDLIIPERFREQHWTGFDSALAAGDSKYRGQTLLTRAERDGQPIHVELTFAIVHDEAGAVIGALGHARDITERIERERQARARQRSREGVAAPDPGATDA